LRGCLGLSGSVLPRASGSGFGLLPNPQKPAIVRFRVPAQPGLAAKPNNCSVSGGCPACVLTRKRIIVRAVGAQQVSQLSGLRAIVRPVTWSSLLLGRLGSPAARDSGHNCSVTQLKAQAPRSSMTCVLKTARAIVRFPEAAQLVRLVKKN